MYYFDLSYERRNAIHELPGIVQDPINHYSKFTYFYKQRDETPDLTGIVQVGNEITITITMGNGLMITFSGGERCIGIFE